MGDPGDPALLVAGALGAVDDPAVCGAALLISAAAFAGSGAPSPVPAVPDVVVVVYAHECEEARLPHVPHVSDLSGGSEQRSAASSALAPVARISDLSHRSGRSPTLGPWRPSWSAADHANAVADIRGSIARGDVYQVCLVGHASAPYTGDPMPALRRVADLPGARYGGVLTGDGWAVACASPETLLEIRGRRVVTRPIKGTRPATATGRAELLASAKERAEHVMIVDLERNDLGRVARPGTVVVEDLYAVRRWCDLWQAESTVSAELADGVGLAELLRAMCPGGSVTGAPKLAALDVIAALEPVGRGPSMGAFGWVSADGLDLGLTIRTVAADADRVHVWAGGGITWDSDPVTEVAEAAAKAAPLLAALGDAQPRPSRP